MQTDLCLHYRQGRVGRPNDAEPCIDCGVTRASHFHFHGLVEVSHRLAGQSRPQNLTCSLCDQPYHCRGYCKNHYTTLRQKGEIKPLPKVQGCLVDGCDKPHNARGYCRNHYARIQRGATLEPKPKIVTPAKPSARMLQLSEFFAFLRQFPDDFKLASILTFRERETLNLHYGLADGSCYTLEEIGRIFQVSRERVRQIEVKANQRLRNYLTFLQERKKMETVSQNDVHVTDNASSAIAAADIAKMAVSDVGVSETAANLATPAETTEDPAPVAENTGKKAKKWLKITKPSNEYSDEELRGHKLYKALKESTALESDDDSIILRMIRNNIDTFWASEDKKRVSKCIKAFYKEVGSSFGSMIVHPDGSYQPMAGNPQPKQPPKEKSRAWGATPPVTSGSGTGIARK